MSDTPEEMAANRYAPTPVEEAPEAAADEDAGAAEAAPGVGADAVDEPTEDVVHVPEAEAPEVPEEPEVEEPPLEPVDETLRVGEDGPAAEEPPAGQVEVVSAERPEPELGSTVDAVGSGPADAVIVPTEEEEAVTPPGEDVGTGTTVEAPVREAPAEEAPAASTDPFRGPGDWYVVHTYAGYENKVKANLESRIHTMQMEDKIFQVHIPMEDVMEIKGGKKQVVQRKVFPGYLLVKMLYDNDSWYVVRNTPGVTGFVAAGTGSKPTPLSRREVEKILAVKKEEVKPQFRLGFEEGDVVRIVSGPFADFNGTISEINVDQSKLKVLVNIFDRETPVELGFDQVAKV